MPPTDTGLLRLSWFWADALYGRQRNKYSLAVNPSFERLEIGRQNPLYGISLPLIYTRLWKDTSRSSTFSVIGRLNSDYRHISGDDWQAGFATIHRFGITEAWAWKGGFYCNTEFDQFFFLPLLGFEWNPSPRFMVNGLLPTYLIAEYRLITRRIHCGALFRSFTKSFRYQDRSYLRLLDNYAALFADFYLAGSWVLNAEGGYAMQRKYKKGLKYDSSKQEWKMQPSDGFMYRVALIYRLIKSRKKNSA